jgi:hypothetical protein
VVEFFGLASSRGLLMGSWLAMVFQLALHKKNVQQGPCSLSLLNFLVGTGTLDFGEGLLLGRCYCVLESSALSYWSPRSSVFRLHFPSTGKFSVLSCLVGTCCVM